MSELKYSEDHEWIRLESDGVACVGITDYAQEQLGDVVFVELPEIGDEVGQGDDVAVVESVKAAADVKAPASGTITEVNELLGNEPELVNTQPMDDGWFYRLKLSDASELDDLMDEAGYAAFCKGLD